MSSLRTKAEWLEEIRSRPHDLRTERNTLLLYAGSEFDLRASKEVLTFYQARAVAGPNSLGFVIIAETPLGRELQAAELYHEETSGWKDDDAQEIWAAAARELCRQASGSVTILLKANVSQRSIFLLEELPTLLQNERVTSINGISVEIFRDLTAAQVKDILVETAAEVTFGPEALAARMKHEEERKSAAREAISEEREEEEEQEYERGM